MSPLRRLILHTPSSRQLRLENSRKRIEYAKNSEKFRSKADDDKTSWPWQIAYLGYAGAALTPVAVFLTAIVEMPPFRRALEGDEFGNGGLGPGRALVGWWRGYYTEGKGFHNEDWPMVQHRRRLGEERRGNDVTVRVKTVTGQVKETSYGSEETVDGVAMRKAMGLMDPVDSVEVMETSGDAEGEPADKTFHESIESRELRALTQRMSAWHNYGGTVGGGGSGGGGGGSSGGGSAVQQQEKALTSSVSVQELEMRIEALDAALNDPNNTLDIDDTLDEIARLKAEKKAQKGWFGWG